jgi:phospholipid/cholesterol/gamma-HCH transport system substrate-binding protein
LTVGDFHKIDDLLRAAVIGCDERDFIDSIADFRILAEAAEELKAATKDARGMITRLEGPTTDFANTGLPQLTRAVTTLQSAAESLDRLVGDIEQNPQGLVSKPPAKEVEVRP